MSRLSLVDPSANTVRQASLVSRCRGFSPSLAAMSAIERSISVVESGSSHESAASPKAPPAAPEAAAATRWKRSCDADRGRSPSEVTATSSAFMSAASVAL